MWELPADEESAVRFLQEYGILHMERRCSAGHEMRLELTSQKRWRCKNKSCGVEFGLRKGTWLNNSRISCTSVIRFIYGWCEEYTSLSWCKRQLDMSDETTVDWNNYLRQVCAWDIERCNSGQIGGSGCIVEIDETLFTKRKNNCGRVLPERWLFGGVCRETNECFLVEVPDRSSKTLSNQIRNFIKLGSLIYSDSWKGYDTKQLALDGYINLKVNHSKNFVNPETKVHTQKIERLWGSLKWRNKRHRGTARHHLGGYLDEFIWRRKRSGDDLFVSMLECIRDFSNFHINQDV